MEFFHHDKTLLLSELLTICVIVVVSSLGPIYTPPDVERLTDRFSRLPVNQKYNAFFGSANVRLTNNGSSADLILDKSSGSGLVSRDKYYYGFFNAALKLPANFTSGVVVAFYRRSWVLQTNLYGNGSVGSGREEKFYLWFDPTQDFHEYTILWNKHHIVFLVDNVPIREVVHNTAISSVYPSKPMSIFATIWDGSEWATHGGKYPVNYTYAPFVTSLKGVELEGCVSQQNDTSCTNKRSTSSLDPVDGEEFVKLSQQQMIGLEWARRKHMFYSYCQDTKRYKVLPPECTAN
ncbi:probable xyloglucan endotransglucosylase/hydrolase protein 33 isoform X2 [Lycium ferocissimum]|uniref:probable xyloglucan endotransglucosylase/hydrolase protein 33 isoform X2 n=1 Tax=Lycium ferocissimum TaxID=112874 RepID=UPI002815C97E|nr:probable xyloglucan endotransglucosylase/hydrolase protein 33 isoform X2 [Lycium ferocissimum]